MKERVFSAFIYNLETREYECMIEWIAPYFQKYMLNSIIRNMFYIAGDNGTEAKNLRCFVFYDNSIDDIVKRTNRHLSYMQMISLYDFCVSCITTHNSFNYSQIYSTIKINNGKGYKFLRRMYIAK